MRLSEALVLKAEWWITNYPDFEAVALELGEWRFKTNEHLHTFLGPGEDHTHWDNDSAANLCLLESELQKDESN